MLLTHPEQLDQVRGRIASWDDVIEEILRYVTPVSHLPLRYAVEDIPLLGGVVIRHDDATLASSGAVGRRPNLHGAMATAFDITRRTSRISPSATESISASELL
ncbi:hypothetical protein [Streptomyces sp. NPDC057748]|uniref:hypothetical protein n=1 Tax=unclassified Streptomyces TaxID=2593676 RepID=UPI00368F7643